MKRSAVVAALLIVGATFASQASASPRTPEPQVDHWPEPLVATFDMTIGPMTWGHVDFEDPYVGLQMSGEALNLDRVTLAGGSVAVAYVGDWLTAGIRLGYGTTFGGDPPVVGGLGGAVVEGIHVFSWSGELGLSHRFGDLSIYAVARGVWSRAIVELDVDELELRGRRPSIGPKIGLRAHVHRKLFLHAALFMDALTFPDHRVTVGLGIGRR